MSVALAALVLGHAGDASAEGIPFLPTPTVSVRATAGDLDIESGDSGSTLAVAAQVAFGRLGLFAEAGKTRYEDDIRVDRYIGLGLSLRILSIAGLQAFARGSGGVNRVARHSSTMGDQLYGMLGVGFSYEIVSHLSITGELLLGQRSIERRAPTEPLLLPPDMELPDAESMAQARLGVDVSF